MKKIKTMKANITYLFYMAALLLLAGCSQDDESVVDTPDNAKPLTFTITDGGYSTGGGTRATEDGYTTVFTEGDACGLYIVNGDGVKEANVKLTAKKVGVNIVWTIAEEVTGEATDSYYLYYPYQDDMTDKVNRSANNEKDFFEPLSSGWKIETDQSNYAKYTAFDLMIAKCKSPAEKNGNISLTFNMSHCMALAVIEMPKTVYKFTNNGISPYTTSIPVTFNTVQPWQKSPGTYRYIYKPASFGSSSTNISGSYYKDGRRRNFDIPPYKLSSSSGFGTVFYVDRNNNEEISNYNLQVGDYLLKDGRLISKDAFNEEEDKENVAAIVFSAGHNQYDISDYSKTGIGSKECHGYAVAVTDAAQNCAWGPIDTPLGCYPEGGNSDNAENDWSGYDYTWNKIIPKAGGSAFLEYSYPAAYYAVKYGTNSPACSSGWFLPAIGQMKEVWTQRETLFKKFEGLSTGGYYWSSSESDNQGTNVKTIQIISDDGYPISDSNKTDTHNVRAVLAF